MLEGFVPYESEKEAYRNWMSGREVKFKNIQNPNGDGTWIRVNTTTIPSGMPENTDNYTTVTNKSLFLIDTVTREDGSIEYDTSRTKTSWVPTSRKYTFNLELDAAYDIGKSIGYPKDLFVGGYAGLNGITRGSISPLEFDGKGGNTLLWSLYVRLEPAIAIHKSFYVLGLFGYENWRSDKAWMMVSRNESGAVTGLLNPTSQEGTDIGISPNNFVRVPIDFRDFAYGIGFDWDVLERVGLHGRFKVIQHIDQGLNDMYREWGIDAKPADKNDWVTPVVSLEVKTWF
jgi:hypothetical protein